MQELSATLSILATLGMSLQLHSALLANWHELSAALSILADWHELSAALSIPLTGMSFQLGVREDLFTKHLAALNIFLLIKLQIVLSTARTYLLRSQEAYVVSPCSSCSSHGYGATC